MLLSELSEVIDNAIVNEEVVRFPYLSNDGVSLRTLSPYEGTAEGVLGYDHVREALRRFNFSKIIDIETIDEDYVRPVEKEDI